MRKSFTRLLSLVVLFGLFHMSAFAAEGVTPTKVWPEDNAYTKTSVGLTITYAEDVVASTGAIRLSDASGILAVIPATDARVSITGGVVTVDVTAELEELTEYSVSLDSKAFETADDGEATDSYSWMFMTGDYVAPVLASVVPVEESVVGNDMIDLVLTFEDDSKIFQAGGNVTVYKEDGNVWDLVAVPAGAELIDGVLTVTGVRKLEDLTNYAVTVDAGLVEDEGLTESGDANPYAGLMDRTVWVFSTQDFTAPGWASKYPKEANVAAASFDVLAKTTEDGTVYAWIGTPMDSPSAAVIRDPANGAQMLPVTAGTEVTFSFNSLSERTDYVVYLIADNDDVETDAVEEVAVTTGETDAPVLTQVYYVYDDVWTDPNEEPGDYDAANVNSNVVNLADGVELDLVQIGMRFEDPIGDEELVIGAGNIIIKKLEDNTVFATIPSTEVTVAQDDMGEALLAFEVSGIENGVEYYVTVPGTLVMDEWGNKYDGISANTGWRFVASDDIAPTYTIVPANAATDVKGDAEIVITFDEVVDANSGDFKLLGPGENPDDDSGYSFSIDSDDNSGKFTVVTLTPDADLPSGGIVQVVVEENNIEDESGNAISDNEYTSTFFFVEDYEGPEFVKWSPAANDPGILKTGMATISMVFDEGIQLLGGTEITADNLFSLITVKNDGPSGSNVAVTYAISDDKKTVSVMPVSEWVSENTYYVAISSDIEDLSGNAYEGSDRAELFVAQDLVQEEIVFEADADDIDGETISTTSAITMTFDDDEVAAVWNQGWNAYTIGDVEKAIILKMNDANGADVPFTATSVDAKVFDIVPTPALEMGETYYLAIGAALRDDGGNVADAAAVTFMTLDEGAPKLTSSSPADKATEVAKKTDVVFTFSVDIETTAPLGPGDIVVTLDGTPTDLTDADITIKDNTLTIDDYTFGENAEVEIAIASGVIYNVDDPMSTEDFAGETIEFSTVDTELELVSIAPDMDIDLDYTDGVDTDEELVLVFGEDVLVGTGNIDIKNYNTDFTVERIAVSSENVTIDDEEVTIVASELFNYATDYYVEISEGAFVDAAGNKSPEIFGKGNVGMLDWTFQTSDPDLEVVSTSPAAGDDKVAIDAPISVTFNRLINFGTTGSVGYAVKNGSTYDPEVYTLDSDNVSIDGKTLTILHPNNAFGENDTIALYLDEDALVPVTGSGAGNDPYGPPMGMPILWTTGNTNAPVATYDPEDEDEEVETDVVVSISFDEDIYSVASGDRITTPVQITDGNIFQLKEADGTPVSFVGGVSGNTVTLTPDSDLDEYAWYFIEILAGTLMDEADNVSAEDTSWFMTTDYTAPVVTVDNIMGGDKQIDFDVDVTDNSNVDKFYYWKREKSADAGPSAEDIIALGSSVKAADLPKTVEVKSLASSTTYEVFYVATDKFDNVSDVEMFEESTNDTDAPVLVSTDPETGSVDVEVSAAGEIEVELTFNEAVEVGTTTDNIILRDQATGAIVGELPIAALTPVVDEDEMLLLTISGLPATDDPIAIYVEMPAASVVDTSDNANEFAGIFGENGIWLTTADQMKPVIDDDDISGGMLSYTMADIGVADNLVITFSEEVTAGAGKAILYDDNSLTPSSAVQVFKASDFDIDGKVLTLNPSALLDLDEEPYYLQLNNDIVQDLAGNEFDSVGVRINVVDDGFPYITDFDIDDVDDFEPGDIIEPIYKQDLENFDFDFNEDIFLEEDGIFKNILLLTDAEIKAKNIVTMVDAEGNAVPFTIVQCCPDDVVFDVDEKDFEHNSSYTITIQGLSDIDGNMMEPFELTFETTDGVVPTAMFNPEDETVDVMEDAQLIITFNEKIWHWVSAPKGEDEHWFYEPFDNDNIDAVVFLEDKDGNDIDFDAVFDGDSVITITPSELLESGMEYTYGIQEYIYDEDDQEADYDEATFTVRDFDAPTFDPETDVAPEAGEAGVVADADMWIHFSEAIMVGQGSVIIRNLNGTYSETVSAEGLSIHADNDSILVIEHANFPPDMEFFVEVTEGAVTDLSGNENAAYVDAEFGWRFTTKDTYEITAVTSPMGPNQPNVIDLVLTFNKNVMVTSSGDYGYYVAVYKADGTAVAQIDAEDLVVLDKVVTYYGLVLEKDQEYYARVEANAFYDASGNEFAGIMDESWEFSTMASIAPQLVSMTPVDNSTAVDPATAFTMTFDRDVAAGTGAIEVRYFAGGELAQSVDIASATIDGAMVSFTLDSLLEVTTEYYVLVAEGVITNTETSADAWEGIENTYDWNFTTADAVLVVPELQSWTPQDTIEGTHPDFVMTFVDDVFIGEAGTLTVTAKDSSTALLVIDITEDMIDGNVVTVAYDTMMTNGLLVNTTYIVNVDAGVLVNEQGEAWAGVSNDTDWTFTTGMDFTTDVELPVTADLDFNVYPNPFNNFIRVDNYDKLTRVVITNIAGQRVLDIEYPSYEIQTGNLVTGVYVVTLIADDTIVKSDRIIKR